MPILWETYEHQFPMFSKHNGFCRILPGTKFPDFPHLIGLAVFSHAMGNWWGNQCISHMMKYTIVREANENKAPILWGRYEYSSQGSPHTMSFTAFCGSMGNWWGNPCISYMMKYTIWWESNEKKSLVS